MEGPAEDEAVRADPWGAEPHWPSRAWLLPVGAADSLKVAGSLKAAESLPALGLSASAGVLPLPLLACGGHALPLTTKPPHTEMPS